MDAGRLRDETAAKSKTKNPKGGQRKPRDVRALVLKVAKQTGFGYTRIVGELRKLGIKKISRQTVRNILNRVSPPGRREAFILVAADCAQT